MRIGRGQPLLLATLVSAVLGLFLGVPTAHGLSTSARSEQTNDAQPV